MAAPGCMKGHRSRHRDSRGQAMVEFSLVILIFMTMFVGIIEFGVAFSVKMQISFASRDAAVVASESGGTSSTADSAILNTIDKDVNAPASKNRIDHVDIFWATSTGGVANSAIERYTPGGPLFLGWGGWTRTMNSYPPSMRCAYLGGTASGCQASPAHSGPDTIGVTIVYSYPYTTPIPGLLGLGGTGWTFTQTNLTTMEPIPTT